MIFCVANQIQDTTKKAAGKCGDVTKNTKILN